MKSRNLVVSAVNFSEGGPLTVLLESLDAASATLGSEWSITALVHDRALITNPRIRALEFPRAKASWFRRVWYEWHDFASLSRTLNVDLWVSLHDITPRVSARRQAVYCHNPSPFYQPRLAEAWFDPKFLLFNKFYLFLYRILIRRNYAVIVQQSWLRDALKRWTGHPNIVVAYPAHAASAECVSGHLCQARSLRRPTPQRPLRLLYPALPRIFKNIEVLCEAVKALPDDVAEMVDLRLTFDGEENRWADELARRYGGLRGISLIGRQNRSRMIAEYRECDVVLFPSRLETWGLPITEAQSFGKPLLVADLPYAKETVGGYDCVDFLPADDHTAWAATITRMVAGTWSGGEHVATQPDEPFARDWPSLWAYLVRGL